jgi:hypothetical protein
MFCGRFSNTQWFFSVSAKKSACKLVFGGVLALRECALLALVVVSFIFSITHLSI